MRILTTLAGTVSHHQLRRVDESSMHAQLRLSVITAFASQRTDSLICCSVMDSRELCVYREHKGGVRVTIGYQVYSIPSLFNAQRYMYIGSSQLLYNSMCYFGVDLGITSTRSANSVMCIYKESLSIIRCYKSAASTYLSIGLANDCEMDLSGTCIRAYYDL